MRRGSPRAALFCGQVAGRVRISEVAAESRSVDHHGMALRSSHSDGDVMANVFKYGLVPQRLLLGRLRRIGVVLDPYFLFREGARPHQTDWPELAREFPKALVLEASDIAAVAACTWWNTVERIRARFDKGHVCIVLKNGGRIAGYTWADLAEVNGSACDYALDPDEAYLYDAFIVPKLRGRKLAPYMRAESYKHLRQMGRHTLYSISECFNTPAIKFKEKLNAEVVRLYLHIRLGRRELGQWLLKDYETQRRSTRAAKLNRSGILFARSTFDPRGRRCLDTRRPWRTPWIESP